jgi:hypothetical protein
VAAFIVNLQFSAYDHLRILPVVFTSVKQDSRPKPESESRNGASFVIVLAKVLAKPYLTSQKSFLPMHFQLKGKKRD